MRLDATRNWEAADLLEVTLEYRVKLTQQGDIIRFSVPLTGGTAA